MTDDAATPAAPAEPGAPRASKRLAARFIPAPPEASARRPRQGVDGPDGPDEPQGPPATGESVAAPWPGLSRPGGGLLGPHPMDGDGDRGRRLDGEALDRTSISTEHFVLPAAVPPEGMSRSLEIGPLELGGAVGPTDPPGGDEAVDPPGADPDGPPGPVDAAGADDPVDPVGAGDPAEPFDPPAGAHDEPDARGAHRVGGLTYVLMALLLVAIPLLGWAGYHVLSTSKNGTIVTRRRSTSDPGFRALVRATPTALVVLRGPDGEPTSVTLLSLSGPDARGGAVVQVPLDTLLATPLPGVTSVRDGYKAAGVDGLVAAAAQALTVGPGETISLDQSELAALVAPVAPLKVDNPTDVTLEGGRVIPAGPVELAAADVGPFLAAAGQDESDLARLSRNQLVWKAWFEAVKASPRPGAVPGEATAGIGRFVRGLAAGELHMGILPVDPVEGTASYRPDPLLTRLMVTHAVPFPVAASKGQRVLVRVLSGDPGRPVPDSVLQRLVFAGAQVTELGNSTETGVATTRIDYIDSADKDAVDLMVKYLGRGEARLVPDTGDSVGVTITLGRDVLDDPPAALTEDDLGR